MDETPQHLKYCLYARKSSESDEKQAMSIGSQLDEMRELAEREGLNVVVELQESHSAKDSGKRPIYAHCNNHSAPTAGQLRTIVASIKVNFSVLLLAIEPQPSIASRCGC